MVWQPEIDEIKKRKEFAAQMGGAENVERQHKRGKLTVRERLERLVDPGSFQEIGGLAGSASYTDNKLDSFQASSPVIGICTTSGVNWTNWCWPTLSPYTNHRAANTQP